MEKKTGQALWKGLFLHGCTSHATAGVFIWLSFMAASLLHKLYVDWLLLAILALVMCNITDLKFINMICIWSIVYLKHGNCIVHHALLFFLLYFAARMKYSVVNFGNEVLSDWRRIHCYKYLFIKNNIKCMFLHALHPLSTFLKRNVWPCHHVISNTANRNVSLKCMCNDCIVCGNFGDLVE